MRGSAHLHSTVCIVSPPDGDDTLLVAPAARFVRNVWLWVHDMTHIGKRTSCVVEQGEFCSFLIQRSPLA
jgi:hypothetical protein